MHVLLTYDLATDSRLDESQHTEVKDAMKEREYFDIFETDDFENCYLPNTTLVKSDITPNQAKSDLILVALLCGATITRLFATEINLETMAYNPGQPFN